MAGDGDQCVVRAVDRLRRMQSSLAVLWLIAGEPRHIALLPSRRVNVRAGWLICFTQAHRVGKLNDGNSVALSPCFSCIPEVWNHECKTRLNCRQVPCIFLSPLPSP